MLGKRNVLIALQAGIPPMARVYHARKADIKMNLASITASGVTNLISHTLQQMKTHQEELDALTSALVDQAITL